MAEYDLQWPPMPETLIPLKRISPSRAVALHSCALCVVWSAQQFPPTLPISPMARFGIIVHRLLCESGEGRLRPPTRVLVERRLSELIIEDDRVAAASWLQRRFSPIANHIHDIEVQRICAIERALELAAHARSSTGRGSQSSKTGFEVWVQNSEGTAGGYIDEVRIENGNITIVDQKTGSIFEIATDLAQASIKKDYITQLKLYAALYHETWNEWPHHALLLPLRGKPWEIPIEADNCSRILEDTLKLFKATNDIILSTRNHAEGQQRLANPSPPACHFCVYRPKCHKYIDIVEQADFATEWPHDLWGPLTNIRMLENQTISLTIGTKRIRGLFESKHPALNSLQPGDKIAVFNLRRTASPFSFDSADLTTIYRLKENP